MPVLVMKFGGTSVASLDKIKSAAKRVALEVSAGHSVIVIVSAMAGKTNELVDWVNETSPLYDAREYDAIVSSGENVTAGLMALTLQEMDIPARSWQGWQVPVRTSSAHSSARIEEIPTQNIINRFNEGMRVAVVAGFQGISETDRVTTLGRGGSDTTAVAFAAAFEAIRCDIYTDVDGIYTTDPRITEKARKLNKISFEEKRKNIKYLGYIKNRKKFFDSIDIFIFPSFSEGLGLVLLEAMSFSKICLTRDISPMNGYLSNESGYLFNDNIEMLDSLSQAINDYRLDSLSLIHI